jgi:AcrR family transcriptional regulator
MEKEKYHHGDLKQALVESGVRILKEQGLSALTLRSAARAAGVSHSAPYAHFADKQMLLAAISTRGFIDLYERLSHTVEQHKNAPKDLLVETGWTYAQFALSEPAIFKLMFSGILEDEHTYPELMAAVRKTYHKLVEVVEFCQAEKVLRAGSSEETAIAVWSLVHGFISLYLERQLPGQLLERYQLKKLLISVLGLFGAREE